VENTVLLSVLVQTLPVCHTGRGLSPHGTMSKSAKSHHPNQRALRRTATSMPWPLRSRGQMSGHCASAMGRRSCPAAPRSRRWWRTQGSKGVRLKNDPLAVLQAGKASATRTSRAWPEHSESHGWKPRPRAPSRSALTYGSGRSIVDHKLERHAVHKPARPGSTGTGFRHYFDR
jgi:hypothetical protein